MACPPTCNLYAMNIMHEDMTFSIFVLAIVTRGARLREIVRVSSSSPMQTGSWSENFLAMILGKKIYPVDYVQFILTVQVLQFR